MQAVTDRGDVDDPLSLFKSGQSVKVRVLEVDVQNERAKLSLAMSECCEGDIDLSVDVIDNYLSDLALIREKLEGVKGCKLMQLIQL